MTITIVTVSLYYNITVTLSFSSRLTLDADWAGLCNIRDESSSHDIRGLTRILNDGLSAVQQVGAR